MIDWSLAASVGRMVAGSPAPAPPLPLAGPASESERVAGAYTRLSVGSLPVAEAIDRGAWIDANLSSMRSVLEPVAERLGSGAGLLAGPVRAIAGSLLAIEVGALSGLMAQRVLGQYEFPMLDPGAPARLLFVAPNLEQAATALDADPDDLLRWVALHETTHALQFGGVPWLRPYVSGLLRELLDSVQVDPRSLLKRLPDLSDVRALVESVKEGGLITLVTSSEQRAVIDRMQSVMSVLEGHAEHVMDAAGEEILPTIGALREGLEKRRASRPPAWRVLEKLLGLDMKMRQYAQGKAFCDAVVAQAGITGLNRVWDGPEYLPDATELEHPDRWLTRVLPAAA